MKIIKFTDDKKIQEILDDANRRSEETLRILRESATFILNGNTNIIIGVNGSVARREMTSGSDVDLFVLTCNDDEHTAKSIQDSYRKELSKRNIKMPAEGGVFKDPLTAGELVSHIGGESDTNTFITRRMLYLLEGEWVVNQEGFNKLRKELISRYVPDDLETKKITRFFLNDVIRYWRTICVDFEHKTGGTGKPRAIRLIKLRLSRMLLYFAGVAAVKETAGITADAKREKLLELLAIPPMQRLEKVYGAQEIASARACYATFLDAINNDEVRKTLEQLDKKGIETDEYRYLSGIANDFKNELLRLLGSNSDNDPLTEALLL